MKNIYYEVFSANYTLSVFVGIVEVVIHYLEENRFDLENQS